MKDKINKRLFLDVHVIQTLPPSCVNRGEDGAPKTAIYGGTTRARISSQSLKRATRQYFIEHTDESMLGKRTLELSGFILKKMKEMNTDINNEDDEENLIMIDEAIESAGFSLDKKKDSKHKLSALYFIGSKQAEEIAKFILGEEYQDADKKEKDRLAKENIRNIIKNNIAIDIKLFGRMLAGDMELTEDATCQVAHAISTNELNEEFDFFTAVDEIKKTSGSGMIGTTEFSSSTMYRFATISVHELLLQLNGDMDTLIKTLNLFVKGFALSMPTGKINSFGNQTVPQLVLVSLRTDRPVSFVSAFEATVKDSSNGYTKESIERLFNEIEKSKAFVDEEHKSFVVGDLELCNIDSLKHGKCVHNSSMNELENGVKDSVISFFA